MPASTETPDVALLVLNWNGADLLRRHLPAVVEAARTASTPARAYVVDNASEDDSRAVVEEFEDIGWIAMPENRKLVAYNEAVRRIPCQAAMLLNNDLSPPHDAVDLLWKQMQAEPDVFAVGGAVRNTESGRIESGPTTARWEREWLIDPLGKVGAASTTEVAYVSAGAGLFRRDMFLELGGFWPALPAMYWEDFELGIRAWLHGWRSVFEPGVTFEHESGVTTRRAMSDRRRAFGVYRNRRLMHLELLLDGADLRNWLRAELSRGLRKPYHLPAALTLLPRIPAALAQRRQLRARCGEVPVAELVRRWSPGEDAVA